MENIQLKDGKEVILRFLVLDDRKRLVEMFSSMSDESLKWSMAPYTIEVINRWLSNITHLIPLVAGYDTKIVGYAAIFKYPHARRKGIGSLLIYIHHEFHNVGLGTVMMEKLLQIAKKENMHKIELAVVAANKQAIRLYKKVGFVVEGVSQDSFLGHDGKYHNMIHMGIIINC
ncbi:MAG: GNAT family N-acetyltransferase [Candidatus Hermodarchaeota archaeon]